MVGHAYGHYLAARGLYVPGKEGAGNGDFAPLHLLHGGANGERRPQRGGAQIVHVQRAGDKAEGWVAVHGPVFGAVGGGGGGAGAVAVDERGDEAAVDVAGNGGVVGARLVDADGFVPFPVAFYLQPMLVEPAAAVAVAGYIFVVVLECFVHVVAG